MSPWGILFSHLLGRVVWDPPPPPPAGIRLPSEGARPSPTGQKEAAPGPRGRCEGPDWLPRGWPRTWLGLSLGAVVQGPGKPCARCPWAPPARVSRRVGHRLGGVAARQAVGTDFCKTVLNTKQAGQAVSLRNQQLCGDWSGKPCQGALPVLRGQRDTHTHTHTVGPGIVSLLKTPAPSMQVSDLNGGHCDLMSPVIWGGGHPTPQRPWPLHTCELITVPAAATPALLALSRALSSPASPVSRCRSQI